MNVKSVGKHLIRFYLNEHIFRHTGLRKFVFVRSISRQRLIFAGMYGSTFELVCCGVTHVPVGVYPL